MEPPRFHSGMWQGKHHHVKLDRIVFAGSSSESSFKLPRFFGEQHKLETDNLDDTYRIVCEIRLDSKIVQGQHGIRLIILIYETHLYMSSGNSDSRFSLVLWRVDFFKN